MKKNRKKTQFAVSFYRGFNSTDTNNELKRRSIMRSYLTMRRKNCTPHFV